jgi:hypothetical protein
MLLMGLSSESNSRAIAIARLGEAFPGLRLRTGRKRFAYSRDFRVRVGMLGDDASHNAAVIETPSSSRVRLIRIVPCRRGEEM